MRVLLIEPDKAVAQNIELLLKSEGFKVHYTANEEDGIEHAKVYDYEIVLTELRLPTGGLLVQRLRDAKVTTPVLVLSSVVAVDARVAAFNAGADGYLVKPFHKDELLAQINAIVRRASGYAQSVIQLGALAINLDTRTVSYNDAYVHLTGKEYAMLETLALAKGRVVTKENFLNAMYGGRDEPEMKIIDVFICKIRRKLARLSKGHNYIETVWGRGYMLRQPFETTVKRSDGRKSYASRSIKPVSNSVVV